MVEVFIHEGILHPRYGGHNWTNYPGTPGRVLNDLIYQQDFKIDLERGNPAFVIGAAASALQTSYPGLSEGHLVFTADAFRAYLSNTQGWTPEQIAAIPPEQLQIGYTASAGQVTYWIVSEADYLTIRAMERRRSAELYYRLTRGLSTNGLDVPFFVQREPSQLEIFINTVADAVQELDGGQIGIALGSVLGNRLSDDPFARIILSGSFSTILGAVGEFIDENIFSGVSSTNLLDNGIEGLGASLLQNIKGAGIGALSSYLTAELVDPRAGALSRSEILSFSNRDVGLLGAVVLDLDGDGVELERRKKSKARFDSDGNGARDDTGWIDGDDGFLVIDVDGNGRIEGAAELGLTTLKPDATNGFDALGALDSNGDRKLDSADSRFAELRIWRDRNGNGLSDEGELRTLAEHGIASISLAAQGASASVKLGRNAVVATSTFTRADGSVGTVGDVALAFKPSAGGAQPSGGFGLGSGRFLDDHHLRIAQLRLGLEGFGHWRLPHVWPGSEAFGESGLIPNDEIVADGQIPAVGPAHDGDEAAVIPRGDSTALLDPRLALLVQEMVAFGARPGEAEWRDRFDSSIARIDYYA